MPWVVPYVSQLTESECAVGRAVRESVDGE